MSSSSEQSQKRWTQKGNKVVLCSIPVEKSNSPRNINVSTIDTNSSPILITRRPLRKSAKPENKQKSAKVEEQKPAEATIEQKPVKKKTKASKNRKKAKPKMEQTDDEKENPKQFLRSPAKEFALFYDTTSPELVREPQHLHDFHFDSPIRQLRKDATSPIRVDLGDNKKSLLEKDLPHFRTRFDSSDEEEDERLFVKSDECRIDPGARHRRKTKEMRELVAPRAKLQEESSLSEDSSNKQQNKSDKDKAAKEDNVENKATKKRWFSRGVAPDRGRKRGYRGKTSKKWFKKCTAPYDFPEPKDPDFERTKTGAPKMRLNSYLEKCKVQKYLDSQTAKDERIVKKNLKDAKTEQKEKLQTRKPVAVDLLSDSSSNTETANVVVATSLTTELQRFRNLRSYAIRLKANEREMISKNVTNDSSDESLQAAKRKMRKRENELNRDGSKRRKMVDEDRPTMSDQVLVHKRNRKEKDDWRIV